MVLSSEMKGRKLAATTLEAFLARETKSLLFETSLERRVEKSVWAEERCWKAAMR